MAQKAAKNIARRNESKLKQTHIITAAVNAFYLLLRLLIFRHSTSRKSLLAYVLFSTPALAIEFWFERLSRPRYGGASGTELLSSGEDLEAKGLTEWMWDVLYWTWGCVVGAALLGDRCWWLYAVVPIYSAWLAWSTFSNVRQGLNGGLAGGEQGQATASSKRQQKLEKRGGQKVQYR